MKESNASNLKTMRHLILKIFLTGLVANVFKISLYLSTNYGGQTARVHTLANTVVFYVHRSH
jgi:uncharacterized membrane protein